MKKQEKYVDGFILRMKFDPQTMPFDGKRMFWGGFKTVIKA